MPHQIPVNELNNSNLVLYLPKQEKRGKALGCNYLKEHIISKWLHDKGIKRVEFAKMVKIDYTYVERWLKHPERYMTAVHYKLLAHVLNRDVFEIFNSVVNPSRSKASWFNGED